MRVLVREKIDAVSLKAKIEEQYNILTALLQAKVTIASVFYVPQINVVCTLKNSLNTSVGPCPIPPIPLKFYSDVFRSF